MVSCGSQKAEIAWVAGADNNDPITEYTVYYNTSFDKPDQYTEGTKTNARKLSAQVCRMLLDSSLYILKITSLGSTRMFLLAMNIY